MNPFFFRNSGKSLFGIYSPPGGGRIRKCGVVICSPIGHEYIHSYRAFRQLAYQLARAGFAVLRFDYYGCGDSSGDAREASVRQWISDVQCAVAELQRRGLTRLCVVGARLGATLAALAGDHRFPIEAAVLWDPIIDGKNYLQSLDAEHRAWLAENPARTPHLYPDVRFEALGFPIGCDLATGLEEVNLLNVKHGPAKHVLTLETATTQDGKRLADHLTYLGVASEHQVIAAPLVWLRKRGADNVVVPVQALQALGHWLSRIIT
jgi:pimeloyl-ACP methyl ester carboxylesterase